MRLIGFPDGSPVAALRMQGIQQIIQMTNSKLACQLVGFILFQRLDYHEGKRRANRAAKSSALRVIGRFVGSQCREGIFGSEGLRVSHVPDESLDSSFIGYGTEHWPEGCNGFNHDLVMLTVDIVVYPGAFIPHQVINPGFQREVQAFIAERNLLVIQDLTELRHIIGIQCLLGVEVHIVLGSITRAVDHLGCGLRHLVQPVRLLKGRLEPLIILFQDRHYLAHTLLVADLVEEVELGPCKQRRINCLRVLIGEYRCAVGQAVIRPYGAVFLLFFVEGIELGGSRIGTIAVYEEKG